MGEVSIIGWIWPKACFRRTGAAADGSVVFRRKLSRGRLLKFVARQPACVMAMEACTNVQRSRNVRTGGLVLPF